ncbi:MAG: chemotaxis protein CheA [Pseudomonadota bacterium]
MDSLRETFFAECEDLIESLTENLELVASHEWDSETINAIFRAVHSIKGAAGAFGFNDLVDFAHHYETTLDLIRSDQLEISSDVLRLIIRSSDNLAELVEGSRVEGTPAPEATKGLIAELIELSGGSEDEASAEEEFVFTPVAALPIEIAVDPIDHFDITLTPRASLYMSGHDPLRLISALAKLGDVKSECDVDALPALENFNFDESYLSWKLLLRGTEDEDAVRDVFQFVEGHCAIEITPVFTETLQVAEEPTAVEAEPVSEPVQTDVAKAAPNVSGPAAKPTKSSGATQTVQSTLRVDPERVDRLINSVGELIINHAVIDRNLKESGLVSNSEITTALDDYGTLAREIQEGVMAIRAQPVKSLFQRMGRVVREAGEATGKKVTFVTEGETTEIDKTMLERLADPLTHMLRNAVDHGIEEPAQRVSAEKQEEGTVRLSAAHRSGHVVIEIADDGAGLDRERLFDKAVEKGIVAADAKLTEAEIYALLFAPGFSTAQSVTNLSGRGVGMDVVKTAITSLGGKVGIASSPGNGSTFTISLPLTLAVLDGMIVEVGAETMVLPLSSIVETIRPDARDIQEVTPGEWVLSVRGTFVPVVNLNALMGLNQGDDTNGSRVFVLIDANDATIAVSVDAIQDQRQVVIKSLKGNYGAITGIAAATILGDGNIALIVDTEALGGLAASQRAAPSTEQLEPQH